MSFSPSLSHYPFFPCAPSPYISLPIPLPSYPPPTPLSLYLSLFPSSHSPLPLLLSSSHSSSLNLVSLPSYPPFTTLLSYSYSYSPRTLLSLYLSLFHSSHFPLHLLLSSSYSSSLTSSHYPLTLLSPLSYLTLALLLPSSHCISLSFPPLTSHVELFGTGGLEDLEEDSVVERESRAEKKSR